MLNGVVTVNPNGLPRQEIHLKNITKVVIDVSTFTVWTLDQLSNGRYYMEFPTNKATLWTSGDEWLDEFPDATQVSVYYPG